MQLKLHAVQETDVTKCLDIKWNCDHDYLREAEIDEKDEEEETDEEDASDSDDNFWFWWIKIVDRQQIFCSKIRQETVIRFFFIHAITSTTETTFD